MENTRVKVDELKRDETSICFLIDIEFLLDTRLALIHRINPDSTKRVLNRDYHQRLSDNFSVLDGTFDMNTYHKEWEERDVTLMMESTITNFPAVLQDMLARALLDKNSTPYNPHIFVDINFGRFKGLPPEHYRAWIYGLSQSIPNEIFIEYCFITIEELIPSTIIKKYKHVAIYEYAKWIEYHFPTHASVEYIRSQSLLGIDFYFPMLLKSDVDMKEFAELTEARGGDFFMDLAKALANILCPRFIEVGIVSVINPTVMSETLTMLAEKDNKDGA